MYISERSCILNSQQDITQKLMYLFRSILKSEDIDLRKSPIIYDLLSNCSSSMLR